MGAPRGGRRLKEKTGGMAKRSDAMFVNCRSPSAGLPLTTDVREEKANDKISAVANAEFSIQPLDVRVNGMLRDAQLVSDLFLGKSAEDPLGKLKMPPAKVQPVRDGPPFAFGKMGREAFRVQPFRHCLDPQTANAK